MTLARNGLTVLSVGVLPVGCSGDEFESCEGSDCSGGGASAGAAGADGDAADSANVSGTRGATGAGGLAGAVGSTDTAGSGSASSAAGGALSGSEASGSSAEGSGSGASSASGTEGGGAGEDGMGSCEEACDGVCCDDVCVDLESDIDHCGACGATCILPNAEEACVVGSCVVSECWDDTVDCNGDPSDGCEEDLLGIAAMPSATRPMLGAFTGSLHTRDETGSLRPEFAWTEVEPVTCSVVTYQVQVDDDCPFTAFAGCDFPSPELDATGVPAATFVPEADLPVEEEHAPLGRRYYWRVRACEGGTACSEWSEVFYVDVGRVREDVTGDGYADVVGATLNSELFIARGREDFYEVGEAEIIPTTQTPLYSSAPQLSFLGDVDGDGFNDVGGAGAAPSGSDQAIYVWRGAETFGALPGVLVTSGLSNVANPPGAWPAGDDNRDGYADILLVRRHGGQPLSAFSLKYGGETLADSPEEQMVGLESTPPPPPATGTVRHATSGDYDGDGYPDQVADAGNYQQSLGFVLGGADPLPPHSISLFAADDICQPVMATLDFNGDAIDDLAVLCRNTPRLAVVFGRRDMPNTPLENWSVELDSVAADLAVGDIDDSGVDDLIVAGPVIFRGASEPDTVADLVSTRNQQEPTVAADHNADGVVDLLLGNLWLPGPARPGAEIELTTEDGNYLDVAGLAH